MTSQKRGNNYRHGWYGRPEYFVWNTMKQRCLNPRSTGYARYGALGVTVCKRWLKFDNFIADMGPRPEGTSLDRLNGRLGYTPTNCRWATTEEQARNRRGVKLTKSKAARIRYLWCMGTKQVDIARALNISPSLVGKVCQGQIWRS